MPVEVLSLPAHGPGLHEITAPVDRVVTRMRAAQATADGLCTLFLRHTSASLLIQENADPAVLRDLEAFFARLVPEDDALYTHRAEGPDDMPAHVRCALTATQLSIPMLAGRLGLGTWQGIFLWEHRRGRRRRELLVHLGP